MEIRRVVAGADRDGRSHIVSDELAPAAYSFTSLPGQGFAQIWRTAPDTVVPSMGPDPTEVTGPVLPGPHGTSFLMLSIAPDSAVTHPDFDPVRAGQEFGGYCADLAATMEPDAPGMHTTDTVDYGIVISGEVWLEVDTGARTRLEPGDVVVQLGNRHAWRNPGTNPAVIAFVLVGAPRIPSGDGAHGTSSSDVTEDRAPGPRRSVSGGVS